MIPHLCYYHLVVLGLLWLCLMLHDVWPSRCVVSPQKPAELIKPSPKRSKEPTPFAGLTQKPHCALCEQEATPPKQRPPVRPDPMLPTTRHPRKIDTSRHFCPHDGCPYRGWLGLGNLRANGHPSGGPWRQFQCTACTGYFPEHQGTIFHGKRVAVELIVRVLACLAEGLSIRATARVFEVDPNTVLGWLVEAAEHLKVFSRDFLCDVHVRQVQLDELYAGLRDVKDSKLGEDEAIKRLERSPRWVWTAVDPESKLLAVIDVGTRTLTMAQRVVHQVVQVLAPDCVPLFLTDGFKEYMTALLAHFGQWVQPPRRQAQGPTPKPRWMPLPQLLYAQVVKAYRRRRIVRVKHRVVFGPMDRVKQALSVCGWQINTAFVERLNLDIRQRVAAVGRRVNTLCKGEDGVRQQLVLFQPYYNFCLPHASLRLPLAEPELTNGRGSVKKWRPCTPAMAAGLTDWVWTLRDMLLFHVPPWPQPQAL
jgi:IS1 family transposase/transposase-like protein